jgi:hypothetical protein
MIPRTQPVMSICIPSLSKHLVPPVTLSYCLLKLVLGGCIRDLVSSYNIHIYILKDYGL